MLHVTKYILDVTCYMLDVTCYKVVRVADVEEADTENNIEKEIWLT